MHYNTPSTTRQRTNLIKTSGLSYNSLGVISSTPLATIPRPSFSVSAGSTSTSHSVGSPTASAQTAAADYFQTMSLSQSQMEKDLVQRPDVTEQGLYPRRLQSFDDYNVAAKDFARSWG